MEEDDIKTTKSVATRYLVKSKWSTTRKLYSAVNSVHSDEKCLITVNVYEGCYFFVFLHRLIYMCLKCPPLANMHVLSHECPDAPTALFSAVPNVYLHN